MKRSITQLLLFLMFPLATVSTSLHGAETELIRHIVVFKYKDNATEDQIKVITDAFRDLKEKIPGIVSFEHGTNNSPENLNRGLTHVYMLTFENAAARDAYLPHPEHKAFGETLRGSGIFEEVFVIDYLPSE